MTERFRLDGDLAVLSTGATIAVALPQVQTGAGGIAHIRVGAHYLDIYSQQQSNVIRLPALGILCGGSFGSDALVPTVRTFRWQRGVRDPALAGTIRAKRRNFQIYIPRCGALSQDRLAVMQRLAADVAYLHEVRHRPEQFSRTGRV